MSHILYQYIALTMAAVYLGYCATEQHRRNHQSWESLVGRLHQAWFAGGSCSVAIAAGRRELWAAYCDAGVIMEMADFAERNGDAVESSFDASFLNTLRADAIQVRIAVLKAVARLPGTR
jgi:hypothetical protein